MIRFGIWTRVSSEEQARDKDSLRNQALAAWLKEIRVWRDRADVVIL